MFTLNWKILERGGTRLLIFETEIYATAGSLGKGQCQLALGQQAVHMQAMKQFVFQFT